MINYIYRSTLITLILLLFVTTACEKKNSAVIKQSTAKQDSIKFYTALTKHLNSVIEKDLETLKTTLPNGSETMHLILPSGSLSTTADEFLSIHEDWFKDTTWTIDFNITYTNNTNNFGIALVESTYREPERNGKPYYNKMLITYAMEKINNKWLVIKDHASSVEKSK